VALNTPQKKNQSINIFLLNRDGHYYKFLIQFVFQINTITENLDLADNYLEAEGAKYLSRMMKDNMFIVTLVSLLYNETKPYSHKTFVNEFHIHTPKSSNQITLSTEYSVLIGCFFMWIKNP
jgi:hypothetical protein